MHTARQPQRERDLKADAFSGEVPTPFGTVRA